MIVGFHYLVNHEKTQNPVDKAFIKFVMPKRWTNLTTQQSLKWNNALEAAVITFSDTQVLTGLAILLCGYIQLPFGISVYHWQVVVALAWFSSLTHLLTLASLRGYLQKRFKMAVCRAIFMGCVIILLTAALVPTGYINQYETTAMAIPARCLFSRRGRLEADHTRDALNTFNTPVITLSIIFLVLNYIIKVIRLFKTVHELSQKLFKSIKSRRELDEFIPIIRFWDIVIALVKSIAVLREAFCEIGSSKLWEVRILKEKQCCLSKLILLDKLFLMLIALAWGTLRLIGLRIGTKLQEEWKWGFGQILPILLLFLPLWSVYEQLFGKLHFSLVTILSLTTILKKKDIKSN